MKKVMFLCGHNAGRSQMAQAFFNQLNENPEYIGVSAGTNISDSINAVCVEAMKEIGIDMTDSTQYYPKKIESDADYFKIFGMGCNVNHPVDEDLGIDDPAGQDMDAVRAIRDEVKAKIQGIISTLP